MMLGVGGDVEAFGQSEALTKRLAHILEQYPDGPNIFTELIQNADDAGATRVCVLYNRCTYGTSSLLSPAMAKWQGPALYCYNNAEFSDSDFINLARIGQASKLQRAATTGRFGLGFNSVYHFTDLPSIVSANSIVMFDPHASHLPGISAANPGIKIRFASADIVKKCPDQFAPFQGVFGCDLTQRFNGTLFRFPLRNRALAEASEIKRRAYSQREIADLFESFQGSITDTMLFLRNVRQVEVYIQSETEQSPVLLYGAEVPAEDRGDAWRKIDRFMRGDVDTRQTPGATEASAKKAFYERLHATPEEELPSATQVLHIQTIRKKGLQEILHNFRRGKDSASLLAAADGEVDMEKTMEKYLVCNRLGGGRAREIACAPENEALKLIPWVGIASRIDGVAIEGRAFCFLPLPVRVGLPVHINGYFELSSNRRDIWHGDDMTGDGKLRSEWNASLLADAVAPAYLTFLLTAKSMCGDDTAKYLSFFPRKLPGDPWSSIVRELFRIMKDQPVFIASSPLQLAVDSTEGAGRAVAPSASVVVDDTIADWETLESALSKTSLTTVHLPAPLRELLIQLEAVYGAMTPKFFRDLTRGGQFLPTLMKEALERVVQFCLSDCQNSMGPAALQALDQLPLLPLKDRTFGRFRLGQKGSGEGGGNESEHQLYYFGNEIEEGLLEMFPHHVINGKFRKYFDVLPSVYDCSNVRVVTLSTILDSFLPRILARQWTQSSGEIFALKSIPAEDSNGARSSKEWLRLLWKYVETQLSSTEQLPQNFLKWPLVPILRDGETNWVRLSANVSLVIQTSEMAPVVPELLSRLQQALTKVGILVVDTSFVNGDKTIQWLLAHKRAHKLTSNGVLAALNHYQFFQDRKSFKEIFAGASAEDKQVLCDFFASSGLDAAGTDLQPVLFELPIFPVHSGGTIDEAVNAQGNSAIPQATEYVSLRRGGYLPDADADGRVLDSSFFFVRSDEMRKLLRDCGVDEWPYARILLDYVFPRLPTLEAQDKGLVDSVLVDALVALPFHQRNDSRFRDAVLTRRIIPSRKRVLRAVKELHDPSISELSDLVGENSLPAEAFSTPEMIEILRALGLRTGLSCHAVLESARSVEAIYTEDEGASAERACAKAHSLLTIVNKHFDTMLAGASSDARGSGENAQTMQSIMAELKQVQWLPVRIEPLDPAMPWKVSRGSGGHPVRVSSAVHMRPEKDAWFCSSSMDILDGELLSEELVTAFGWRDQVDSLVLAEQLKAIGSKWESYHRRGGPSSSPSATAWRFPLAEVHQMYEELESFRLRNEDKWKESAVYHMLMNGPWIWTGKGFVQPCQIAVEADASLEPLLFSAPSAHIISRSLLVSFGLKDAFSAVEYLEATMRLPLNTRLSEEQVSACLKIYELLGQESVLLETALGSFASRKLVLLDQSRRLVPAIQLTFDDMEWNESREVRRGAKFVSKKVPKSVAAALGALSLHSKLAQTSVSSRRVVCPPINALERVLPTRQEWYHSFLWEMILAAERCGGSQIDFFLDYRHHPAQRVIQPSLQPLQGEALCIHIHNMVLSEDDINTLFHGDSSRPGLLCGFVASDCMQILSGDGFYVLDPTGCYLATSPGSATASASASDAKTKSTGLGRRYEALSQDFVRYPDQLLPFTTLPSCPSNVSKATASTVIRFPWRKASSTMSSYTLDEQKVSSLISFIKSQLQHALVFTESVHRISLWSVGKESEFASHCHGEVSLDSPERTLRKRNTTRQNTEWKKKFSLHRFFKGPVVPENQVQFTVNLELENQQHRDTWLLSDNIGMGRSRDLACSAVHEVLHSTPYVSVACHLLRDGNPAPRLRGRLFKIADTRQQVGLPVHINGCFKKAMRDKQLVLNPAGNQQAKGGGSSGLSGSEQQITAGWNRVLLEDNVANAYVKLLLAAKESYERSFPKALYNIWPSLRKGRENELGSLVQMRTYRALGPQELFRCTDGSFRGLSSAYLLDFSGMDIHVASFAQLHFPSFDIPARILADCSRLVPSRVAAVTPKTMRRFLRSAGSSDVHSEVCLSLLEYCLSDVPFPLPSETDPLWAEFHGLSLLPLEDGSIGVMRVNQRRSSYILASFNQIQLLSPLGHLFVSVAARHRLHKFFSDDRFTSILGLASFSIKTISDNIERVLPGTWKNRSVVNWDPSSPSEIDRLWLYRFWQEVRFERRSLAYFAAWPLIPIKGSQLMSCGRMGAAFCVWPESGDAELAEQVVKLFEVSGAEHEAKMTEMELERKHLMELSAIKYQTAEDDDDSESDEEGEGDDEEEKEAPAGDAITASDDEGHVTVVEMEEVFPSSVSGSEEEHVGDEWASAVEATDIDGIALVLENEYAEEGERSHATQLMLADGSSEALSNEASPVEEDTMANEFCSRETLHGVISRLNLAMVELAYLTGQESDIVPRSSDVALTVLDGIFASMWRELHWDNLSEDQSVLLAEFFSHSGDVHGGYNRAQLDRLKQLPLYVNICDEARIIYGRQEFFLIPPGMDLAEIPLPPSARQYFLKSNPRLSAFYKELGVKEMSDAKLMIYALPMFEELVEPQRDQILAMLLRKWQSLRGEAELIALLRTVALFRDEGEQGTYHRASAYCDPRNKVLATIYDGMRGQFPAERYQTPEWLDLMGEIGLRTEVTVEIFVECAQRIDALCSGKRALTLQDEHLVTTLHQFFVQNFEKFDRSRWFFETIAPLAFVPALVYEISSVANPSDDASNRCTGHFASRTVVRRYADCATPDDQALVYSTMPILSSVALPPRVLWSRLGIMSPPPTDKVVAHLLSITNGDHELAARSLDWQFFLPMVEVFQEIFKFLQAHWGELNAKTQRKLTAAAVIPVGSTLVKGSSLFFHLGENLAPLMFEVPRAFGAYDTLFRHMGSKEGPEVSDYLRLLRDVHDECHGQPLNLNELIAVSRAVELLADALTESNHRLSLQEKRSIFLPSDSAKMQSMLVMVFNDSAALCARIDLTELHVVHPRISTRCCQVLGVPGIGSVVHEELVSNAGSDEVLLALPTDDVAHFNCVLASPEFAAGLRKLITAQQQKAMSYDPFSYVPDFEDLNHRIGNLTTFGVTSVTSLQSRFIAKLDSSRTIDVSKTSTDQGSLAFVDQPKRQIYLAKQTLETRSDMGMRASQLVAGCVNQLLGGVLQDCSVLESILTCDVAEIPTVLQLLSIYEDPVLINEKLRGLLGEPLSGADLANVELAPLRSCLPGELVAVEDEQGTLCYGKVLQERATNVEGVSHFEVKVAKSATRWLLATQLYFFRSARRGNGKTSAHAGDHSRGNDSQAYADGEEVALPSSVVPRTLESRSDADALASPSDSASMATTPASSRANVLSAVNDLLSRLNVSLDTGMEELLAENLRLKHRLELAEEGRRSASAQIDEAVRQRKDAENSLVCAVCLENKVDRVLIPCGHIYCGSCVERLPWPSCPICRHRITSSSAFHAPS